MNVEYLSINAATWLTRLFYQGIYETKVPLEFSAILQTGCVCKVDKAAKKRNPQDGWSLSELHMKTTTECPYLDQSITFFYLYHRQVRLPFHSSIYLLKTTTKSFHFKFDILCAYDESWYIMFNSTCMVKTCSIEEACWWVTLSYEDRYNSSVSPKLNLWIYFHLTVTKKNKILSTY